MDIEEKRLAIDLRFADGQEVSVWVWKWADWARAREWAKKLAACGQKGQED